MDEELETIVSSALYVCTYRDLAFIASSDYDSITFCLVMPPGICSNSSQKLHKIMVQFVLAIKYIALSGKCLHSARQVSKLQV